MSYEKALLSFFGPNYKRYIPLINNINLYCIFIITLILSCLIYTLHHFEENCENTFIQRVKSLRMKNI